LRIERILLIDFDLLRIACEEEGTIVPQEPITEEGG
jgi:hypothetical protein